MVIAMPNSKGEVDFVILTSINYGLARVGGPVVSFTKSPPLNLNGEKEVCICGHGGIGTIEGEPAKTFADVLADPLNGCKSTLKKLMLTCCYAGLRQNNKVGTSTIDIIAETLQIKDLPIQGALGPSIKANVLGEHFRVVNENVRPGALDRAGDIQEATLKKTGAVNLGLAEASGANKKLRWSGIQRAGNVEATAQSYASLSETFFQDFVAELEKDKLLFDSKSNMAVVHWDGTKVADGMPAPVTTTTTVLPTSTTTGASKSAASTTGTTTVATAPAKKSSCYITTATVGSLGLPDDCEALTTLRRFRDEVMLKSPAGRRDVAEYYATAPAIVAAIDRLSEAPAIYRSIYGERIEAAVAAVQEGRFTDAHALYRRLVHEARDRFLR